MVGNKLLPFLEMIRAEPVQSGLFTLGPVAVALVQLLNSYVNGLSPAVSIPFAAVLLTFSVLLVRYQFETFRLGQLERETVLQPAD